MDVDTNLKEQYELHLNGAKEAINSLDKALLTLVGGAIAISLVYVEKVAVANQTIVYLKLSWLFLVICLLLVLVNFLMSYYSWQHGVDFLTSLHDLSEEIPNGKPNNLTEKKNWFSIIVGVLNIANVLIFVLGIGFLLYFAAENIQGVT